VANLGEYAENFSLTVYANTTAIGTEEVTALASYDSVQLVFVLNTTDMAYGSYLTSVYAWPVQNETNVANNNCTGGNIIVSIPGDINGDGKVNLSDLALLAMAYNTKPGDAKWNPNADIKSDGRVDLADLAVLARNYNKHL